MFFKMLQKVYEFKTCTNCKKYYNFLQNHEFEEKTKKQKGKEKRKLKLKKKTGKTRKPNKNWPKHIWKNFLRKPGWKLPKTGLRKQKPDQKLLAPSETDIQWAILYGPARTSNALKCALQAANRRCGHSWTMIVPCLLTLRPESSEVTHPVNTAQLQGYFGKIFQRGLPVR